MGLFSPPIKTLDDLFVHTLRDIYYVERGTLKAFPNISARVHDPELKGAIKNHIEQTRTQVSRVEEVFRLHDQEVKGVNSPPFDGIIEEIEEIIGDVKDDEKDHNVSDQAIRAWIQAIKHYEISRYGTLAAWAKQLGRSDAASILHSILDEEKTMEATLENLASARFQRRSA